MSQSNDSRPPQKLRTCPGLGVFHEFKCLAVVGVQNSRYKF